MGTQRWTSFLSKRNACSTILSHIGKICYSQSKIRYYSSEPFEYKSAVQKFVHLFMAMLLCGHKLSLNPKQNINIRKNMLMISEIHVYDNYLFLNISRSTGL